MTLLGVVVRFLKAEREGRKRNRYMRRCVLHVIPSQKGMRFFVMYFPIHLVRPCSGLLSLISDEVLILEDEGYFDRMEASALQFVCTCLLGQDDYFP